MNRSSWRRGALVAVLVAATGGYAAVPPSAADARTPGMTLGHVSPADAPLSASVIIGTDAAEHGYATPDVTISQGGSLSVVNRDEFAHTVTAVARDADGLPLFDTEAAAGHTVTVHGVSHLAAGTYDFYCKFHQQHMRGTLTVEGGSGGTHPAPQKFEQPLKLPRVITSSHPHLIARKTTVRVLPHGPRTTMWTLGGSYPGPTIRRPVGHDTRVTVTNHLPKSVGPISVHLHGDHHSSANDGQPTTHRVLHDRSRTYDYPLTDAGKPEPAAFDFYHDHVMGRTGRNNWYGLQGMLITDDPRERALGLPSGRHDLPLMIADRSFTKTNQLTDPFNGGMGGMGGMPPNDATVGDRILVDGRVAPYQRVSTHRYRLRIVNASNFSSYDLALSDGRPFLQIGTGDALLRAPIVRTHIPLGPAQRADVVIDFAGELGERVVLQSLAGDSAGAASAVPIMQFRVATKVSDHSRVPTTLLAPPKIHAPTHVSYTWHLGLRGGKHKAWTINGHAFSPHRVDVRVPLGATRTWRVVNDTTITHYVHLHEEQWHTILRDGKRPPKWERGLEDTWRLDPGESIVVAARFTDYTGVFMIHCHMLDHEDDGMMAQFEVVRTKHRLAHTVAFRTPVLPLHAYAAQFASLQAGTTARQPVAMSDSAMSGSMSGSMPMSSSSSSAAPMSMAMSMPMGSSTAASMPGTPHAPRWLVRAAQAIGIEALLLGALLVAVRRRRRLSPA